MIFFSFKVTVINFRNTVISQMKSYVLFLLALFIYIRKMSKTFSSVAFSFHFCFLIQVLPTFGLVATAVLAGTENNQLHDVLLMGRLGEELGTWYRLPEMDAYAASLVLRILPLLQWWSQRCSGSHLPALTILKTPCGYIFTTLFTA